MSLKKLFQELYHKGAEFIFSPDGALYSMNPPETLFGATYHAHAIPPFKPETTLILGYGNGTIAHLMRRVYGSDLKITGVDCQRYENKFIEYRMHTMDAWEYIIDCTASIIKKRFDYICVDLWDGNKCSEMVYDPEFVIRMRQMCKKMVSINSDASEFKHGMKPWYDNGFNFEYHTQREGSIVSFWSVIEK